MSAPQMYVITLTYTAPLDAIDAAREDHWAHLQKGFDAGLYVAAGPQVPRVGGVILATGDRADVERHLHADPFMTRELASATITEFTATRLAPSISL